MNYATIKYYDIANGPGVRTSVFVSGCRHHCPGCFNAVAWDFDYGQPFDKPTRNEVFASCQPDYIAGLSLLGGEPMEPENQRELLPFVRNFKALYPNKTVWCYSGYTWEQLTGKEPSLARCEATDELLSLLDVLVDGEFVEAKHDISLRFRGSSNQRLLDVKKTLAAGEPVWWEDEKVFGSFLHLPASTNKAPPFGGAGCEHREQTERVPSAKKATASAKRPIFHRVLL